MPESEFRQWEVYAARRMLPQRRLEMYLAQIAKLISQTMGGNLHATLQDFLFDPIDDDGDATEEASAEDAQDFFNFNPRGRRLEADR